MSNILFEQKWGEILAKKRGDEFSLFVPPGKKPTSQRQFNLFSYYKLIKRLTAGKGYKDGIEFGCGRGTISLYLNKYEGMNVSLFDISEDSMNLARANFELHGGTGDMFTADSAKVPKPDDSYDLVVSIGLLEHLPNYEDTLREMYRLLRPGGMLVTMNIPKKLSIQALNDWYKKVLRLWNKNIQLQKDYFRVPDKPVDFKRKAEAIGFKDCKIIHTNPFPIFTPVSPSTEKLLTMLYRAIMCVRKLYRTEPMQTGPHLSQCHFLIGYK